MSDFNPENTGSNAKNLRKRFTVSARTFSLRLGRQTKIMGILNLTPDSFSGDGCMKDGVYDTGKNVALAEKLIRDGADIVDLGGQSTRPGAKVIAPNEEIKRVIPTLRRLTQKNKKPISVDTYQKIVARHALDNGASIINNIMGVYADRAFLKIIKRYGAVIVLMHIRGTPQTMQKNIHYENLLDEIIAQLHTSIEKCLEIGIKSDKIIIDPGIGFGKTAEHNLQIIRGLTDFRILDKPILIGTSRKSFIGKILKKEASERLIGTVASVSAAILNGAHIVRVHDVRAIKDVVRVTDAILK